MSHMLRIFPPKMLNVVTTKHVFPSCDVVVFHTTKHNVNQAFLSTCWLCLHSCHNRRPFWLVKTEWKSQKNFNLCVIYARKVNSELWTTKNKSDWRRRTAILFFFQETTRTCFLPLSSPYKGELWHSQVNKKIHEDGIHLSLLVFNWMNCRRNDS